MTLGVARARESVCSLFLLVNPDLVIAAADVLVLWEAVRTDPLTLVSPRILRPDATPWFAGADLYLEDGRIRSSHRRPEYEGARREPWLSGACIMLSAGLWDRVGGFSEEYFLYWEDVDLSHRIGSAGGRLLVCTEATAVHAEGGTQTVSAVSAGSRKSALYYFYNIRNRLLFASRNLPTTDLLVWRRATLGVSWEILLQGGRRQLVSVWPLVAAARGALAGLAIVRRELRRRRRTGVDGDPKTP
jgi:GT2 family glycosyltransferase